jgi:CRP-like cAMP-binding protein
MIDRRGIRNQLLRRLDERDWEVLAGHLEPFTLETGRAYAVPGQPIEHVFFFEEGLSSEIIVNPDGQEIEGGCFGHEGMSPPMAILGIDRSPHKSLPQVGGRTHRLPTSVLLARLEASAALRSLLMRYLHVVMLQLSQTTIANGRYSVYQRLARWILMCQDRLGDRISLSHEYLGVMLGVRRAGVTDALHLLEGTGAIRSARMLIQVRDRQKLLAAAAGSYGIAEAEYRRLIGPFHTDAGAAAH